MLGAIGDAIGLGGCFDVALVPDADGLVDCTLYADTAHCSDLGASVITRVSEPGGEICEIPQVPAARAGIDTGWTYDYGNLGTFSHVPRGCSARIATHGLPAGVAALNVVCR